MHEGLVEEKERTCFTQGLRGWGAGWGVGEAAVGERLKRGREKKALFISEYGRLLGFGVLGRKKDFFPFFPLSDFLNLDVGF